MNIKKKTKIHEVIYSVPMQYVTSFFTFVSYADCLMTSGAIQKGVPTNVCLKFVVLVSCPATPKSASFTSPTSDNNTLAAAKKKKKKKIIQMDYEECVCVYS